MLSLVIHFLIGLKTASHHYAIAVEQQASLLSYLPVINLVSLHHSVWSLDKRLGAEALDFSDRSHFRGFLGLGEELLRNFGWVLPECLHLVGSVCHIVKHDVLALRLLRERELEYHISEVFFVGQCQVLVGIESGKVAV